jgi:transposase
MSLKEKDKYKIIILHELGYTYSSIAREMKVNRATVIKWIKKYKLDGNIDRKEGSGRPHKTTTEDDNKIINLIKTNKYATADKIKNKLDEDNINISKRTVIRRLNQNGFKYKKPLEKPFLNDKHKLIRIKWAEDNLDRDWSLVVFSDEANIIKGHNGHFRWVNINDKSDFDETVKYPLKINIWACIKKGGPNRIHIFENTMDAEIYKDILCGNILDLFTTNNNLIFQNDNDPKHRSKSTGALLKELNIINLNWPSYSPDLNPIENVWHLLKSKMNTIECNSKDELIKYIENKWNEIDVNTINNIINSMPNRLHKVILYKGNHIDY